MPTTLNYVSGEEHHYLHSCALFSWWDWTREKPFFLDFAPYSFARSRVSIMTCKSLVVGSSRPTNYVVIVV